MTDPIAQPPDQAAANEGGRWLVACSRDRTLMAQRDHGKTVLVKIYERGSLDDARTESSIGSELNIEGVVRYHGANTDEATGRPCVIMDFHDGGTLAQRITSHGPLHPRHAARLMLELARILQSLSTASVPSAPHGIVHCDIKPDNLLLVSTPPSNDEGAIRESIVLLDFEHAVQLGSQHGSDDFTGGTHGYAPPEAYQGAPPTTSFDVFALGATLHQALLGKLPFPISEKIDVESVIAESWVPCPETDLLPEDLLLLLKGCLATDGRLTLAEVANRLEHFLDQEPDGERLLDDALVLLHAGNIAGAERELAAAARTAAGSDRLTILSSLTLRRKKMLARIPAFAVPALPESLIARIETIASSTPKIATLLKRFPGHAEALATRQQLRSELDHMIEKVPPAIAELKRSARFTEAVGVLDTAISAVAANRGLPSQPPSSREHHLPIETGPLRRDPERFLRAALSDLLSAAETHEALLGQLGEAEAQLDLGAAETILKEAARAYSGASEVVAGLKDRLLNLRFHIERIAQPWPSLKSLQEQLELAEIDLDLEPLHSLRRLCALRADITDEQQEGLQREGLRTLQRSLQDLLEDFPHVHQIANDGAETLARAMESLTDMSWILLGQAAEMLSSTPIPIRPLQSIINRIDSLRILEVLVDRDEQTRVALLDKLERVRTRIDQARTTRDRIARGAQEAMNKGHLTTALYDMARAVDTFDDETETGALQLSQQLENARRQKEKVETFTANNLRLANHYAELRDNPESKYSDRLGVLNQRREILKFLAKNLHADRADLYSKDLCELTVSAMQEHSLQAETLLDAAHAAHEKLQISEDACAKIEGELQSLKNQSLPDHAQWILTHWRKQSERLQRELEETEPANLKPAQQKQRLLLALKILTLIAAVVATTLLVSR